MRTVVGGIFTAVLGVACATVPTYQAPELAPEKAASFAAGPPEIGTWSYTDNDCPFPVQIDYQVDCGTLTVPNLSHSLILEDRCVDGVIHAFLLDPGAPVDADCIGELGPPAIALP